MKIAGRWIIGAAFMGLGNAYASVTMCNDQAQAILYSTVQLSAIFYPLNEKWVAAGWYELKPGECKNPSVEELSGSFKKMYFSILGMNGKTHTINHYKLPESSMVGPGNKGTSTGAELFFCVRNDSFKRTEKKLSAHETCPVGYYPQLFNMVVVVPGNVDYTLHIR